MRDRSTWAAASIAAEAAGERLEPEQVQAAAVAELDTAATVAAAAVQVDAPA